jgi:hypothetical protein
VFIQLLNREKRKRESRKKEGKKARERKEEKKNLVILPDKFRF